MFKRNKCTEFETESIKSSVFDYFDTFTLIAGDIIVSADNNADVAFTNYSPFSTCKKPIKYLLKQNSPANFEKQSIKSRL